MEFEGFDPRTQEPSVFRLDMSMIDRAQRYEPEIKLLNLHCVRQIVEQPTVAFKGLRTVDAQLGDPRQYVQLPDPDALCLAGIPGYRVLPDGSKARAPEGYTFAVFTDRRLVVFDWDWIISDPETAAFPTHWQTRFGEKIWPIS